MFIIISLVFRDIPSFGSAIDGVRGHISLSEVNSATLGSTTYGAVGNVGLIRICDNMRESATDELAEYKKMMKRSEKVYIPVKYSVLNAPSPKRFIFVSSGYK